jgi:hypothetical protein
MAAGKQLTIVTATVSASGSVPQGQHYIEFVLSSDFAGTIAGTAVSGATLAIYSPGMVPEGYCFAALAYTISAGSALLTYW